MKRAKTVEEVARLLLVREMGREVVLHDDGTRPSMYDLRIGSAESPEVAIECVGAVDPIGTATWNEGPARGPILYQLRGDWHVVLRRTARVRRARARLERVLQDLEAEERLEFTPVDWRLKRERPDIYKRLTDLRIESTSCFQPKGSGRVHLGMPSVGGAVDGTGRYVPAWLSAFLRDPDRSDVLLKLVKAGAPECHVFIPVSFGAVPWSVESYLGTFPRTLPTEAPNLPSPVAQAWICYGGRCIRWDGARWLDLDATIGASGQDAA